jgi:hypothetical protein
VLEADLLEDARRGGVGLEDARDELLEAELVEEVPDEGPHGVGCVALVPGVGLDQVADLPLAPALDHRVEADVADGVAVDADQQRRTRLVDVLDPLALVPLAHRVGVDDALADLGVVQQRRQVGRVLGLDGVERDRLAAQEDRSRHGPVQGPPGQIAGWGVVS